MKRPRDETSRRDSLEGASRPELSERLSGQCSTYIQILGTVTGDSCPSILVVTETAKYLFNAGDGLQVKSHWPGFKYSIALNALVYEQIETAVL